MGKAALWIGLVLLLVGGILIFLSGLSGPNMEPTIPALYGANQAVWTGMAVIGLILLIVGIILHFLRKNQSV